MQPKVKLFIVEDDICQIKNLLCFFKDTYPYINIDSSSKPHIAMARIVKNKPHIIITDHAMPGLDGSLMIKTIRHIYQPSSVILLSLIDFNVSIKSILRDFDHYLRKPLLFDDLKQIIDLELQKINKKFNIKIDSVINSLNGSIRDKSLIKNTIILAEDLIRDNTENITSICDFLSEKFKLQPDTIRKNINRIRQMNISLFGEVNNVEFLLEIIKKIEEEV